MSNIKWVKIWISEMSMLNDTFRDEDGKIDFQALGREEYSFRMALIQQKFAKSPRASEAFTAAKQKYEVNAANGRKGGRPRKISPNDPRPGESANLSNAPKSHTAEVPGDQAEGAESLPANGLDITEVYEFAEEWHLDDIDCREWWEMTVRDRGGCDRAGNPILNWKGAVKCYCAAKAKRRAGK